MPDSIKDPSEHHPVDQIVAEIGANANKVVVGKDINLIEIAGLSLSKRVAWLLFVLLIISGTTMISFAIVNVTLMLPTPTPTTSKGLKLVDVSFIEKPLPDNPVSHTVEVLRPSIDVKVRNNDNEIIFLKKAQFVIYRSARLDSCIQPLPFPPSRIYDINLSTSITTPYTETLDISQVVHPNDVDRFEFSIGYKALAGASGLFLMEMELIYNETNAKLKTEKMLLLVPSNDGPWFDWSDYFMSPDQGGFCAMNFSNTKNILNLAPQALRHQSVNKLETLINTKKVLPSTSPLHYPISPLQH